jgi:hypothetical protein
MAERNFDDEYQIAAKEGHSFTLAGQVFRTKAIAPVAAFRDKETGLDAAIMFLKRLLVPEDREAFDLLMDNEDAPISPHQIDQIATWLIEETSGRPTESPAGSGSGAATTST